MSVYHCYCKSSKSLDEIYVRWSAVQNRMTTSANNNNKPLTGFFKIERCGIPNEVLDVIGLHVNRFGRLLQVVQYVYWSTLLSSKVRYVFKYYICTMVAQKLYCTASSRIERISRDQRVNLSTGVYTVADGKVAQIQHFYAYNHQGTT